MKTFRNWDVDQNWLPPPSLGEFVPADHVAHFIRDLVRNELDLTSILSSYDDDRGYPPYHPGMMVAVLLYAYTQSVYSSRRISRCCEERLDFMALTAMNRPDFRTISDFRKRHLSALADLFLQVLLLCRAAGLVRLGHVAIDGTKLKANASRHKAMSYARMVAKEAALEREVRELLERAEATDREEDERYGPDHSGHELPEELARRESRLRKIREAKAALEEEARAKARAAGKDPDQARPPEKAQRNFTDPESKIQKTRDGYIQGYNAQVAVEESHQIIVAQQVTAHAPDVEQLLPVVKELRRVLRRKPKQVIADAGYWSEENVRGLEKDAIEPFIATQRLKHDVAIAACPLGRPPAGLTAKQRMQRKLQTQRGRKVYARRKAIVEAPFGQIKHARGFRQFLRRGLACVQQEWALIATAHNLLKLRTAW